MSVVIRYTLSFQCFLLHTLHHWSAVGKKWKHVYNFPFQPIFLPTALFALLLQNISTIHHYVMHPISHLTDHSSIRQSWKTTYIHTHTHTHLHTYLETRAKRNFSLVLYCFLYFFHCLHFDCISGYLLLSAFCSCCCNCCLCYLLRITFVVVDGFVWISFIYIFFLLRLHFFVNKPI